MKIKIPHNYIRKHTNNVSSLKKSLKKYGQAYPILTDENGYLIDGKRRLEALGSRRKDVKKLNVSAKDRLEFTLMINLTQENLNPIDLAKALNEYKVKEGISNREIAKRLPISKTRVDDFLSLLKLPKDVQDKVSEGKIKMYQIEKLGKKKSKINSMEKFRSVTGDRQFISLNNRISAMKRLIRNSSLSQEQLFKLKEKCLGLGETINEKMSGAEK